MKKLILFVLTALLVVGCGQKQEEATEHEENSLEAMELRGKVKSVTEVDEAVVHPEWMAFSKEDYSDKKLIDYEIRLTAFCLKNGYTEGEVQSVLSGILDVPDEFDYYSPSVVPYEDEEERQTKMTYLFDEKGNLTTESFYAVISGDKPFWQDEYAYDDHHRVIRINHFDDDHLLSRSSDYEYNENGWHTRESHWAAEEDRYTYVYTYENDKCVKTETYVNDKLVSFFTNTYDIDGNQLSQEFKSDDFSNRWEYDYYSSGPAKGRESERRFFTPDNKLNFTMHTDYADDLRSRVEITINGKGDTTFVRHYKMDENDNDIYEAVYTPESGSEPEQVWKYEYDKEGRQIFFEMISRDEDEYSSSRCKYDKKGRETERDLIMMDGGLLRLRTVTIYGANDRVIEEKLYMQVIERDEEVQPYPERLVRREKYEYDSQDNWIKREVYFIDVTGRELLTAMETRTIEYYE